MKKRYRVPSVLFANLGQLNVIDTSSSLTEGEGPQPGKAEARQRSGIWDE